jgi:two-component system, cell cycle sensor histidine kinase and response regulator CckA
MPPPPSNPVWDEPSMLGVCAQAASLAARVAQGFAGVCWETFHDGEPGEWLMVAGQAPEWKSADSRAPHPWLAHEPLIRVAAPGLSSLTIAAHAGACPDTLREVAALLAAGSLSTSGPRLRQMLECTQDGVFLLNRDWRFTYLNRTGAKLLNRSPEMLVGAVVWDCFPEAVGSQFQRVYARVFETGEPEHFEEFYAPLDTWFQVNAFVSGDELAVYFRDVTRHYRERDRLTQVEAELRLALQRLQRIADASQDIICTWTGDARFHAVSMACKRILGYDPEEMAGRRFTDFIIPEDQTELPSTVRKIKSGHSLSNYENRYRHKDGRTVRLAWSSVWSAEDSLGFAVAREVTKQYEAERRLRENEERYRLIFHENPQMLWLYDDETLQILDVNNAALEGYGYTREEFLRLTALDLVHPEELELAHQVMVRDRKPAPRSGVWLHCRKDGSPINVKGWSHPLRVEGRSVRFAVGLDVTRERVLQQQLRQAQKMEAVGELAGGIAHDFNNLLTVINGYAEMALRLGGGADLESMLTAIQRAGSRAAQLTQQLLAFSRRQVLQAHVFDLSETVRGMEPMLRRAVPENIELVFDSVPAAVRADAAQIEQVLLNLVLNARDAMEGGAGRIGIQTRPVVLDSVYAATRNDVTPGPYVLLSVTDSGHGMDAATVARVFEPFFTTKERGRGTGLGLPTAYGIVKQSGGHITVYSEPGVGSTFKVFLPEAQTDQPPPAAERRSDPRQVPGGDETILLVEDSAQVRAFTRLVLEQLGYSVVEAADGQEALEASATHQGEIHLLLTDVVLPRVSGREVAQRLEPRRPAMRVLFVSGYSENAIVHHGVLEPGLNFLPKPFNPETLARKVRQILDQPRRPRCVLLTGAGAALLRAWSEALQAAGYLTIEAPSSTEAMKSTRYRAVDLIVASLDLPGYSPAAEIAFYRQEFPHIRVLAAAPFDASLPADRFLAGSGETAELVPAVRALIG